MLWKNLLPALFTVVCVVFIITCDKYNIVEPRFFSSSDIEELAICGSDSGTVPFYKQFNRVDWPDSNITVFLDMNDNCFQEDDTLFIRYRMLNTGPDTISVELTSRPAVRVVFDSTGWVYPLGSHWGEWTMTLLPNGTWSDSLKIVLNRFNIGYNDPDLEFHITTSLVGSQVSYPIVSSFTVRAPFHAECDVLPPAFFLTACWTNESKTTVRADFSVPLMGKANFSFVGNGGDLLRGGMRYLPPGIYRMMLNVQSLDNGVYGVTAQAGEFEKTIWFEVE